MSWDGDIQNAEHKLTAGQVVRLLEMTEALRNDHALLETVLEVKKLLAAGDTFGAKGYWGTLLESEQGSVWVAPTFGGIFTTEERSLIKYGEKE